MFVQTIGGNCVGTWPLYRFRFHLRFYLTITSTAAPTSNPKTQNLGLSDALSLHQRKGPPIPSLHLPRWLRKGTGRKGNSLGFQKHLHGVVGRRHPLKIWRRSWTARTMPRPGPTLSPKPCQNLSKRSCGSKPLRYGYASNILGFALSGSVLYQLLLLLLFYVFCSWELGFVIWAAIIESVPLTSYHVLSVWR